MKLNSKLLWKCLTNDFLLLSDILHTSRGLNYTSVVTWVILLCVVTGELADTDDLSDSELLDVDMWLLSLSCILIDWSWSGIVVSVCVYTQYCVVGYNHCICSVDLLSWNVTVTIVMWLISHTCLVALSIKVYITQQQWFVLLFTMLCMWPKWKLEKFIFTVLCCEAPRLPT